MKTSKEIYLFTMLFCGIFLLCGCKCDKTCSHCYPVQKFDYKSYPLTQEQLAQLRSTDWEKTGETEVLPSDKLKKDMKTFQEYLLQLEAYYRQSSDIVQINRKDIVRKEVDGSILLHNQNGQILNGVYVFALHKNFYIIMEIHDGLPDGACISFYYLPSLCSYASGYYKNGKPVNGLFSYIYESDILLPYSFSYYKGVLVTLSTNKLVSFPFWKDDNVLSNGGEIINGYNLAGQLKDVTLSDRTLFNYYKNLKFVECVELKNTEKNLTFSQLLGLYQSTLNVVMTNQWSPKSWR